MFTGLIRDVGRLDAVETAAGGDRRLVVATRLDTTSLVSGASVAVAGVCLTVVGRGESWLAFDVSAESLARTTIGDWAEGDPVNLEPSLRLGDELGGHLVFGHVDGVAVVEAVTETGEARDLWLAATRALAPFLAEKGSVAVDGASMTVNAVADGGDASRFRLTIVPETLRATTLGAAAPGTRCHIEVDMLARYVQRALIAQQPGSGASP